MDSETNFPIHRSSGRFNGSASQTISTFLGAKDTARVQTNFFVVAKGILLAIPSP